MNIKIKSRSVGNGQPCFIIAEAGVNHNGDIELAKKLVIEAKKSGADCVKFQTFKAERVVAVDAPKASYQLRTTNPNESQIDMLKKLELPLSAYRELITLCDDIGIIFMSTPYSEEDVEFLEELGVSAYKLASISISEPSFLRYVAKKQKPMIISTGMSTLKEVCNGVKVVREAGHQDFILLQCTTNYPTALEDANVSAMITIKEALKCIVGFSDHTQTNLACIAAVSLGASVIEKHFTLDKSMQGPDQSSSYSPDEFKNLVEDIRNVEIILGSGVKFPAQSENMNKSGMRRSVVAKKDIPAGAIITESMLTLKRPGTYFPSQDIDILLGRVTIKDIKKDSFINKEDIDL